MQITHSDSQDRGDMFRCVKSVFNTNNDYCVKVLNTKGGLPVSKSKSNTLLKMVSAVDSCKLLKDYIL